MALASPFSVKPTSVRCRPRAACNATVRLSLKNPMRKATDCMPAKLDGRCCDTETGFLDLNHDAQGRTRQQHPERRK